MCGNGSLHNVEELPCHTYNTADQCSPRKTTALASVLHAGRQVGLLAGIKWIYTRGLRTCVCLAVNAALSQSAACMHKKLLYRHQSPIDPRSAC